MPFPSATPACQVPGLSAGTTASPAEGLNTRFESAPVCTSPKVELHDGGAGKETYAWMRGRLHRAAQSVPLMPVLINFNSPFPLPVFFFVFLFRSSFSVMSPDEENRGREKKMKGKKKSLPTRLCLSTASQPLKGGH